MHLQGRWQLPEGETRSQEGRAGRAAEGVHQRVAEAEKQGGGGAAAAQGEADQEEGDPGRAGEEAGAAEAGGGDTARPGGGRQEGARGRGEAQAAGGGRDQAAADDAGPEGEAERGRRGQRGRRRQQVRGRGECLCSNVLSSYVGTLLVRPSEALNFCPAPGSGPPPPL